MADAPAAAVPSTTDAAEAGAAAAPAAAGGFRQRKNRSNLRKRPADEEGAAEGADEDSSTVVRKAKQGRAETELDRDARCVRHKPCSYVAGIIAGMLPACARPDHGRVAVVEQAILVPWYMSAACMACCLRPAYAAVL